MYGNSQNVYARMGIVKISMGPMGIVKTVMDGLRIVQTSMPRMRIVKTAVAVTEDRYNLLSCHLSVVLR